MITAVLTERIIQLVSLKLAELLLISSLQSVHTMTLRQTVSMLENTSMDQQFMLERVISLFVMVKIQPLLEL